MTFLQDRLQDFVLKWGFLSLTKIKVELQKKQKTNTKQTNRQKQQQKPMIYYGQKFSFLM